MAVIRGVIKWCLSSGVEHRIANPVVPCVRLIQFHLCHSSYLKPNSQTTVAPSFLHPDND